LVHEEGAILLRELQPFPKDPRKYFSLGNLGFSLGREGVFLLKELGPFHGKIHCSLGKSSFSPKNLFGTCSLLFPGKMLLKGN
jgi:hypothetical protein